ncbi:MAG: serine protease [Chloroflexota bacterium]
MLLVAGVFGSLLLWVPRETAVAQQDAPTIIGGEEATPGAWPWMAALVSADSQDAFNGQFCGGSLIAPTWVLTAAHCTEGATAEQIHVVLGRHTLSSNVGERIPVAQIIDHPNYNSATVDNDISLLRLSRASSQTAVAPLSQSNLNLAAPGTNATVTGWGNTSTTGSSFPDELRQVTVPIVSNQTCNAPASYNGAITDNMLCAGFAQGGKDSCQGDSGGPLVVPDGNGGWAQVGVVSWGNGCAEANFYGVYARVSNYDSWIAQHTGDNPNPPPPPTSLTQRLWLPIVVRN